MSEPILNLSAWIDRRRQEVGPYADHIVHSVKAYEARITALEAENQRLREALEAIERGDDSLDGMHGDIAHATLETRR